MNTPLGLAASKSDLGQIFRFLQKVIFADFDLITSITRKFMK